MYCFVSALPWQRVNSPRPRSDPVRLPMFRDGKRETGRLFPGGCQSRNLKVSDSCICSNARALQCIQQYSNEFSAIQRWFVRNRAALTCFVPGAYCLPVAQFCAMGRSSPCSKAGCRFHCGIRMSGAPYGEPDGDTARCTGYFAAGLLPPFGSPPSLARDGEHQTSAQAFMPWLITLFPPPFPKLFRMNCSISRRLWIRCRCC